MKATTKNKGRHDPAGKKAAIADAALLSFAKHGYEGASRTEIAKTAGVKKSAIAFHFGSKEGLWRECLSQRAAPMVKVMDRFIKGEVKAENLIQARVDLHQQYPEFGKLFAWASMEPVPIPDVVADRKDGLLHQLNRDGDQEQLLRFLFALAAVDGWFLFRNLYRRLVGDSILADEVEEKLRRSVMQAVGQK